MLRNAMGVGKKRYEGIRFNVSVYEGESNSLEKSVKKHFFFF